jgi:predicted GIY-YIG superfamily endonuclease
LEQGVLRTFSEGWRSLPSVYLIRNVSDSAARYVDRTRDRRARMKQHNGGASAHTSRNAPWQLQTYVAFSQKHKTVAFERYRKSGSGQAFASGHL